MHVSQASYRELFDLIRSETRRPMYTHVLAPWFEMHPAERDWLRSFASRNGSPIPPAEPEDLWRLYALNRVNEVLLLRFQRGQADGADWSGPEISLEEYVSFAESLGLTVAAVQSYSPFYHEIVEVDQSDHEEQPVKLRCCFWPCLMLGNMLFSRAGVRISGGRRFVCKEVAETSTLYWAHWRKNRPYQDLSHGWGSNSQWRTSFRRDYRIGQEFYYNVDGTRDLGMSERVVENEEGLDREERIELLTNRCFVSSMKPHRDLWPYEDRYQERG